MSQVVLLQPNSNRLKHHQDYVTDCNTSTNLFTGLNTLKILLEVVLLQIITALNTVKIMSEVLLQLSSNRLEHLDDYVIGCITSTKL